MDVVVVVVVVMVVVVEGVVVIDSFQTPQGLADDWGQAGAEPKPEIGGSGQKLFG